MKRTAYSIARTGSARAGGEHLNAANEPAGFETRTHRCHTCPQALEGFGEGRYCACSHEATLAVYRALWRGLCSAARAVYLFVWRWL